MDTQAQALRVYWRPGCSSCVRIKEFLTGLGLEYESVKHLAPTFHGDTLYSESKVLEKTESTSKPDRGVLYVETRCWNQRDETVLTLRRRILTPKRAP